MRIVSGKYKGIHIPVRKNFKARPTTDFAKENLFNILANHFDFEEAAALDLFSGTGSLAYELASRGCTTVDLVEKDYQSIAFIKKTVTKLRIENIRIIHSDVWKYIDRCSTMYDIIVADPPYQMDDIEELPDKVFEKKMLSPQGWFILEHSSKHQFKGHKYIADIRKYGSVNFSIFAEK